MTTHFCRLIDLTSADEPYIQSLTQALAPCVLRGRSESALHFGDKSSVRFVRDLFNHKDAIFNELKRHATLQHSASVLRAQSVSGPLAGAAASRARAISTDESNRRAHMEERQRAIASRSRATSPSRGSRDHGYSNGPSVGHDGHRAGNTNGGGRNHRRDSSRGPETRFPVATPGGATSSPRSGPRPGRAGDRDSLEVPGHDASVVASSSALSSATTTPQKGYSNGAAAAAAAVSALPSALPENGPNEAVTAASLNSAADIESSVQKSDSLGRRGGMVRKGLGSGSKGSRSSLQMARDSNLTETDSDRRGVELVDRPMDD